MKIKSMTAVFGKLEHATLELGDGLNLIYAPNEGGKSTWCAFLLAMLYGIDTRDRDKKGHLADKNRWQPWSCAPMEGELILEWGNREIAVYRGPAAKGNIPFGAFSAVYTDTGEPVPGLTGETCGELLTGASKELFRRSAFLGGDLAVTPAPELEKRVAALVSSGEENVSFSQAEARLREWMNRRRVNRSVGQIPKLEEELHQVEDSIAAQEETTARLADLEARRAGLEAARKELEQEQHIHRRTAQNALNARFAQATQALDEARAQLAALEQETAKYGPLPSPAELKRAQGELQYIKVLEDEIRQGEAAVAAAAEKAEQAQAAAGEGPFAGVSGEEALRTAADLQAQFRAYTDRARALGRCARRVLPWGLLLWCAAVVALHLAGGRVLPAVHPLLPSWHLPALLGAGALVCAGVFAVFRSKQRAQSAEAAALLSRWSISAPEELSLRADTHAARMAAAGEAVSAWKAVRTALEENRCRREQAQAELLQFVHTFSPDAETLFGCSASISRALSLNHELTVARDRVQERKNRRDDLLVQGGQEVTSLELLHTPVRSPEETDRTLADVLRRLEQVNGALNQARGQLLATGDPTALWARREHLRDTLSLRLQEYDALSLALEALNRANTSLRERFSPGLNRLAGSYLNQLTDGAWCRLTLNRELEGTASRAGEILPRSALSLSRGTVDQLYLAVRLAVCQLCLPEKPPLVLDDALIAFDDRRLVSALKLLRTLAAEQQILLFTCQTREGDALAGAEDVTRLSLSTR